MTGLVLRYQLEEVVVEKRLQRDGIDVGTVCVPGIGPEVIDQEASRHVQGPVIKEDDKCRTGRPLPGPQANRRSRLEIGRRAREAKPFLDLELIALASLAKRKILE